MNRASPQMRSIAQQLMAAEAPAMKSVAADTTPTFGTLAKLRPHLSMLMGQDGYQALLARALTLAASEAPWLKAVRVVSGGELQSVNEPPDAVEGAGASEGEAALLAHLLGLLVAFIGPALTARLILQMWPELSADDVDFSKTASTGKAP